MTKFLKSRKTCNETKLLQVAFTTSLTIHIMQLSSFGLLKMILRYPNNFFDKASKHDSRKYFNLSKSSVAFHIETSHLIYTGNQILGLYRNQTFDFQCKSSDLF